MCLIDRNPHHFIPPIDTDSFSNKSRYNSKFESSLYKGFGHANLDHIKYWILAG